MKVLAADPAGFVAVAKEKLSPAAAGPSDADAAAAVRDLDGPAFATRAAAAAKLDRFGEAGVSFARATLAGDVSAEVRARLTEFLEKHDGPPVGGDKLRRVRAVELLEHLRTPDALAVLRALAAGGGRGGGDRPTPVGWAPPTARPTVGSAHPTR